MSNVESSGKPGTLCDGVLDNFVGLSLTLSLAGDVDGMEAA